jgi:hypothetical protein
VGDSALATLGISAYDMTGYRSDADPASVVRWQRGAWGGYEDTDGNRDTDLGGIDSTISFEVTRNDLGDPFVVEPGSSAMWYDVSRNGEGFMLEIISTDRALVYWFSYDTEGNQDWYFGDGEIRGNQILFQDMMKVSGGVFGPGWDSENIDSEAVGSAIFTFSSCDSGVMNWTIGRDGGAFRKGRMNVSRLTRVMGLACTDQPQLPELPEKQLSGAWYDPARSGEGFTIEILSNHEILAFWFSYDTLGNRRWFFGIGEFVGEKIIFEEMLTTEGGVFGKDFDPDAVEALPWGSMEFELGCSEGIVRFEPQEAGFPAGSMNLSRLTQLQGLNCNN